MKERLQLLFDFAKTDPNIVFLYNILAKETRLRGKYLAGAYVNYQETDSTETRTRDRMQYIESVAYIQSKYEIKTKQDLRDVLLSIDLEKTKESSTYAIEEISRMFVTFNLDDEIQKELYEKLQGMRGYDRLHYLYTIVNAYIASGKDKRGKLANINSILYDTAVAYRVSQDENIIYNLYGIMTSFNSITKTISDNDVLKKSARSKTSILNIFSDDGEFNNML